VNAVTRSAAMRSTQCVLYTATPRREPMTPSTSAAIRNRRCFAAFGAGLGGPIVRNRLWFFADYEQQLRNNPIPVINSALATNPSNLDAFVLANFFPPSVTTAPNLPTPSSLTCPNNLPQPGTDLAPDRTMRHTCSKYRALSTR